MNRRLKYNLIGLVAGLVLWQIFSIFVSMHECGEIECTPFPNAYYYTFLLPLALIISLIIFNLVFIKQSFKRILNIKILSVIIFCSYILTKILMFLYRISYLLFMSIHGFEYFQWSVTIDFFKAVSPFLFISGFVIFMLWFSKKRRLNIKSVLMDTCLGLAIGFFAIFMLITIFGKFLDFDLSIYLMRKMFLITISQLKIAFLLGWIIMLIVWIVFKKRLLEAKNEERKK